MIFRQSGTAGWATFADGIRTQQLQGSVNVAIKGAEISSELKNMRLRAVTESASGEPAESGELFHRDFTVGQIHFQVSDEENRQESGSPPSDWTKGWRVYGYGLADWDFQYCK